MRPAQAALSETPSPSRSPRPRRPQLHSPIKPGGGRRPSQPARGHRQRARPRPASRSPRPGGPSCGLPGKPRVPQWRRGRRGVRSGLSLPRRPWQWQAGPASTHHMPVPATTLASSARFVSPHLIISCGATETAMALGLKLDLGSLSAPDLHNLTQVPRAQWWRAAAPHCQLRASYTLSIRGSRLGPAGATHATGMPGQVLCKRLPPLAPSRCSGSWRCSALAVVSAVHSVALI